MGASRLASVQALLRRPASRTFDLARFGLLTADRSRAGYVHTEADPPITLSDAAVPPPSKSGHGATVALRLRPQSGASVSFVMPQDRKVSALNRRSYFICSDLVRVGIATIGIGAKFVGLADREVAALLIASTRKRQAWRVRFKLTGECAMTVPDARRPLLTCRVRRGAMEPTTRLRKSWLPAISTVLGGGIRANVGVRTECDFEAAIKPQGAAIPVRRTPDARPAGCLRAKRKMEWRSAISTSRIWFC
jgi:hypothetical protein